MSDPSTVFGYRPSCDQRDLRIDYLRGLIMVFLIVVHFEFISIFSLLAWGRLGLFSSAEGFVMLSGLVVGMVYRKKSQRQGLWQATTLLWKRAFVLYRTNVMVITSIALLAFIPNLNLYEVMHWTSLWTGESFSLYPSPGSDLLTYINKVLLLKIGPHQYQILGLYVVLLCLSPLAFYLLNQRKTLLLLLLSVSFYALGQIQYVAVTGARYELAFPTIIWQFLFYMGLVAGFHWKSIATFITGRGSGWIFPLSLVVVLVFMFISNNNANTLFWPWGQFQFIETETYHWLYLSFFDKTSLGVGRIINNLALFLVGYELLTRYWQYFNIGLGWLLIPIGQNSLYVFTLHIYFTILIYNTGLIELNSFWINSLLHLFVILSIWAMVKRKVLFNLIPR